MASIFKRGGKKNRHGKYIASWFDENGKRLSRSTGTTDRDAAHLIASKWETDTALRRQGVIDSSQARVADHSVRLLNEHVREYLDHCEHIGQDSKHRATKNSQLQKFMDATGSSRLADVEPNRVERYLAGLVKAGKSHRTHNQNRSTIVAFMQWCFEQGRVLSNKLKIVPTLNEARDRRRVRRALTENEMSRLLAASQGRSVYYLFAYYTGLRVKAVKAAVWGDVDFEKSLIRVKVANAKGKKDDVYQPLHANLIGQLIRIKPSEETSSPNALIFPQVPTIRTFHRDCERAGIDRYDAEGRQVDRHALRTTLGTNLARAGVLPQLAMKVMGHTDVQTTMKHYTDLRIADTANAVNTLPAIQYHCTAAAAELIVVQDAQIDAGNAQQIRQQLCGSNLHEAAVNGSVTFSATGTTYEVSTFDNLNSLQDLSTISQSMSLSDLNTKEMGDSIAQIWAVSSVG